MFRPWKLASTPVVEELNDTRGPLTDVWNALGEELLSKVVVS
jgi:hypothetical protein